MVGVSIRHRRWKMVPEASHMVLLGVRKPREEIRKMPVRIPGSAGRRVGRDDEVRGS